jgi:sterol desaturase/sphingolipid hydroxylase (fatty acid hydroxylase superfamily)
MLDVIASSWASTYSVLKHVAVVFAIATLLEYALPAERSQPVRHRLFNVVYTVLFFFITFMLLVPTGKVVQPLVVNYGQWMVIEFPAAWWGQVFQALAFFLVFDFFYYWFHRGQHTIGLLWRQHRLHHSEKSLNVTSTLRHHWLEEPLRAFLMLLPMGILFQINPSQLTWLWSTLMLWGYFIHMNVRLQLGPLTPVIAGPQLHRLHHSFAPEHQDKNYAAFFPIWDILFGTYVAPKRNEFPVTGLADGADLNGLWRASVSPFLPTRPRAQGEVREAPATQG